MIGKPGSETADFFSQGRPRLSIPSLSTSLLHVSQSPPSKLATNSREDGIGEFGSYAKLSQCVKLRFAPGCTQILQS